MPVLPFLLLASGVLAQNAPQPETTISYRPPADPAASWSSYDRTKAGPLFAEATIEGRRAAVMVDTGVTFTTLDLGWIKQFSNGAEAQPTLRVAATGGTASAALGPVVDLSLPSYDVHRLQTLAADFSGFKSALSRPVDMALGMNVIGVGSLELDLGAAHWRFAPTGIRWPQAATARLLYTPDRYHSYIVIDIEGHVLRLGVDTGYDGGLMLTKNAAMITGLFDRNPTTTVASVGLGGMAISTLTVPTKMKFGASELSISRPRSKPTVGCLPNGKWMA
ncbi:aspartyl protease family protein [Sphingomonas sp. 22176]|uniref:aspartyl protease family protein n=1 Tax=Sphingomonas sp. 22176 TaxID=3453884 RepID=UPI003F87B640